MEDNLESLFGEAGRKRKSGGLESLFGAEKPRRGGESPSALDSLFGGASPEDDRPRLSDFGEEAERRFCRNCRHSFLNAFVCRCTRTGQEVEPMADCPDFSPRIPEKAGTEEKEDDESQEA